MAGVKGSIDYQPATNTQNIHGVRAACSRFASFPDKTTAKVAAVMLLCGLAHLAQKRAAATRTKGQVPSFLIRMADKGGVVAVMNVGLALTIDRDYRGLPVYQEGTCYSLFRSATHQPNFRNEVRALALVCTALVFFKYNRAAMASYGLYEVLLSYRTKENRRAVCDFVTRQLPTKINTKADALAMLGFPSESKPSVEKVRKRHHLLCSFCQHALPKLQNVDTKGLFNRLHAAQNKLLINTTCLGSSIPFAPRAYNQFARYPDRAAIGAGLAITVCVLAHLEHVKARSLKKQKKTLPPIIQNSNNSEGMAFIGAACYIVPGFTDHLCQDCQTIRLEDQNNQQIHVTSKELTHTSANRTVQALVWKVLITCVCFRAIKEKMHPLAISLFGGLELFNFYQHRGDRNAIHNLIYKALPQEITSKAEARTLFGLDGSASPQDPGDRVQAEAYKKIVNRRHDVLTHFIYITYHSRTDILEREAKVLKDYEKRLNKAKIILLTPAS